MDLVDWDEARFREIEREFAALLERLGVPDGGAIPVSALHGDNVVERSEAAPWYDGPALLERLEDAGGAPADRNLDDARLPVQWVVRATDYRGYAGQVASGVLRPGDEVVVLPGGERTRIERIETFDGPLEAAFPPLSVTVLLADDIDAGRGSMICRRRRPAAGRAPARGAAVLDDRRAGQGGRALRAQAHDAPRARADRVARRAARRRDARGRPAARRSSCSTTSAACISIWRRR